MRSSPSWGIDKPSWGIDKPSWGIAKKLVSRGAEAEVEALSCADTVDALADVLWGGGFFFFGIPWAFPDGLVAVVPHGHLGAAVAGADFHGAFLIHEADGGVLAKTLGRAGILIKATPELLAHFSEVIFKTGIT